MIDNSTVVYTTSSIVYIAKNNLVLEWIQLI